MFEQLDDPKLAGGKSWKERLVEGAFRKKQLAASAAPWITAAPHLCQKSPGALQTRPTPERTNSANGYLAETEPITFLDTGENQYQTELCCRVFGGLASLIGRTLARVLRNSHLFALVGNAKILSPRRYPPVYNDMF